MYGSHNAIFDIASGFIGIGANMTGTPSFMELSKCSHALEVYMYLQNRKSSRSSKKLKSRHANSFLQSCVLDATIANQCPLTSHLCPGHAVTHTFWAKVNDQSHSCISVFLKTIKQFDNDSLHFTEKHLILSLMDG